MKRVIAIVLGIALIVPAFSTAAGPSPPHSKAFGKSLSEWMVLYQTWALGGDQANHVGRVQFLPIPQGEPVMGTGTLDDPLVLAGELDVTLSPGTPFVLPVSVLIGETYIPELGYPDDSPFDASIFTESDVLVTLDDRSLIDSNVDDLRDFYIGPVDFDPTIFYEEPTNYGSIGAIFVQGIGFVHPPLSKGSHSLQLLSEIRIPEFNYHIIFMNEWTITVAR